MVLTAMFDPGVATRFADLTLGHLTRPWPYKLDQILTGPEDLIPPERLHPIFHGSFDWHSCVHGWWQVMRIARRFPALPQAAAIDALADRMLTPTRVQGECAYFARPMTGTFERPYGWAWLLALHGELAERGDRPWAAAIEPLARIIAARFADFLPRLRYPVRSGKHDCTAFALILAYGWAERHDRGLAAQIASHAVGWFGTDRDACPWEPSGEDFLSATLCEAVLMREVLPAPVFAGWFARFMPDPTAPALAGLRTPVIVDDRSDGRLAHLDGLNLSRAWCWARLADAMGDPARALRVADAHLDAALPHLADDYMGEHWLATFALLALDARHRK